MTSRLMIRTATAVTACLLPLTAAVVSPAAAAPATGTAAPTLTLTGAEAGYPGVVNGRAAQRFQLRTHDGQTLSAYCLDPEVDVVPTTTFRPIHQSQATGRTPVGIARAGWIASNSATVGTPLPNANLEAVAVQLAVWNQAAGLDYASVPNSSARNRASQLVAATPESVPTNTGAGLVVTARAKDAGKVDIITVRVQDGTGMAAVGAPVEVTSGRHVLAVTTDSRGIAKVHLKEKGAKKTARISATRVLPAGTVLMPDEGQRLVTASGFTVSTAVKLRLPEPQKVRQAVVTPVTVSTPAPPSPTPSPKPSTPAKPTPTPSPSASQIAKDVPDALAVEAPAQDSSSPWLLMSVLALVAVALLGAAGWSLVKGENATK